MAFVGRSNVGKSSLINALVRRKAIARTSKSPGKTRDCNVFDVEHRLYLVDLPGYGYARVSKGERRRLGRLIEQYIAERERAVGVVWLLDIRHDPSTEDHHMAQLLAARRMPIILALTKADKVGKTRRAGRVAAIVSTFDLPTDQTIVTSAVTGTGIDDLRQSVLAAVEN